MMRNLFITTNRQYRFILALLEHGLVSTKELQSKVGALNIPDVRWQLKKYGWDNECISCIMKPVIDRDNKECPVGYYSLSDDIITEAIEAIEVWEDKQKEGSTAIPPSEQDESENDSQSDS